MWNSSRKVTMLKLASLFTINGVTLGGYFGGGLFLRELFIDCLCLYVRHCCKAVWYIYVTLFSSSLSEDLFPVQKILHPVTLLLSNNNYFLNQKIGV